MKPIIILNILLAIAFAWSVSHLDSTREQYEISQSELDACQKHASRIESCRAQVVKLGLAENSYDCSSDIGRIIRSQNISEIKPIMSRVQTEDDGYIIKSIDNALNEPIQLKQLVNLMLDGDQNEVRIFTESIGLSRPAQKSKTNQPERWDVVDLKLKYIQKPPE